MTRKCLLICFCFAVLLGIITTNCWCLYFHKWPFHTRLLFLHWSEASHILGVSLWGHKSKHTFHEPLDTPLMKFAPSLAILTETLKIWRHPIRSGKWIEYFNYWSLLHLHSQSRRDVSNGSLYQVYSTTFKSQSKVGRSKKGDFWKHTEELKPIFLFQKIAYFP